MARGEGFAVRVGDHRVYRVIEKHAIGMHPFDEDRGVILDPRDHRLVIHTLDRHGELVGTHRRGGAVVSVSQGDTNRAYALLRRRGVSIRIGQVLKDRGDRGRGRVLIKGDVEHPRIRTLVGPDLLIVEQQRAAHIVHAHVVREPDHILSRVRTDDLDLEPAPVKIAAVHVLCKDRVRLIQAYRAGILHVGQGVGRVDVVNDRIIVGRFHLNGHIILGADVLAVGEHEAEGALARGRVIRIHVVVGDGLDQFGDRLGVHSRMVGQLNVHQRGTRGVGGLTDLGPIIQDVLVIEELEFPGSGDAEPVLIRDIPEDLHREPAAREAVLRVLDQGRGGLVHHATPLGLVVEQEVAPEVVDHGRVVHIAHAYEHILELAGVAAVGIDCVRGLPVILPELEVDHAVPLSGIQRIQVLVGDVLNQRGDRVFVRLVREINLEHAGSGVKVTLADHGGSVGDDPHIVNLFIADLSLIKPLVPNREHVLGLMEISAFKRDLEAAEREGIAVHIHHTRGHRDLVQDDCAVALVVGHAVRLKIHDLGRVVHPFHHEAHIFKRGPGVLVIPDLEADRAIPVLGVVRVGVLVNHVLDQLGDRGLIRVVVQVNLEQATVRRVFCNADGLEAVGDVVSVERDPVGAKARLVLDREHILIIGQAPNDLDREAVELVAVNVGHIRVIVEPHLRFNIVFIIGGTRLVQVMDHRRVVSEADRDGHMRGEAGAVLAGAVIQGEFDRAGARGGAQGLAVGIGDAPHQRGDRVLIRAIVEGDLQGA